ncbi:transposase-like protein, partial [Rhizoctonia solani AG-3 Rhs1AP]
MAVTGHYEKKVKGKNILVVELLAFRVVEGTHSGVNLGGILFGILSEYEILGKIGTITLDNAKNNDTMMEQLEVLMWEAGYLFDKEGNRVR